MSTISNNILVYNRSVRSISPRKLFYRKKDVRKYNIVPLKPVFKRYVLCFTAFFEIDHSSETVTFSGKT